MPLMAGWSTQLPLVGAGGEAVDLRRTLLSHGFVELPPMRLEEDIPALEVTLAVNGKARTTEIALRGAGGEPVDLRRTIASHGVADLPPNRIDEQTVEVEQQPSNRHGVSLPE